MLISVSLPGIYLFPELPIYTDDATSFQGVDILTTFLKASNMLDTPNFFWDSEPTLHPLYNAVREYLEIKARIQVLNERCRVFLDLAEVLSDAIADKKRTCKPTPLSNPPD